MDGIQQVNAYDSTIHRTVMIVDVTRVTITNKCPSFP